MVKHLSSQVIYQDCDSQAESCIKWDSEKPRKLLVMSLDESISQ